MAGVPLAVCAGDLSNAKEDAARLAGQGVRSIECPPSFFLANPPDRIVEASRPYADHGIRLRSVHAPFGKECNLSAPEAEARADAIRVHERLLRQCAHAGVFVIIVHPGTAAPPEAIEPMLDWCAKSLRELAPIAEDTGVRLGLENMLPKHPGTDGESLRRIVEEVDSPALGICFDSGHAHCNGDMPGIFEALKDRIITFHLHDNDGRRDLHFQPPYGTIDWEAFVRVFRTMRFEDDVTIEAAPWQGDFATLIEQVGGLLDRFEARIADEERRAAQRSS